MTNKTDSIGGVRSLFSELRRRRVLRSSAIYIAVAWLLLQVVTVVFPIFELPDTYQRYAMLALVAGFPVMIVLSWLFDFDLGKVSRTSAARDEPASSSSVDVHAGDFKERMKQFSVRSVAVMPFANVGGNEEYEFFSDGIAEELINLLSKSNDLNIAARTSSFSFKQSDATVQDIALRLGVRHILEGSVRREGKRVRISAQLIDALSGFQVWSSSYDRQLTDIFAVQDEISSSIVYALSAAINQTMGGTQSLRNSVPTHNIEAYQFYLRGMYLWQRRGTTAINAAITALNQAIDADPDFVEAMSLLAVATAVLHEYSGTDRELDFDRADEYARRAMQLAPDNSMAHAVLGYIAMRRWQWEDSERHFKAALKYDSNEPLVHQWYSNLLNDLGRQKTALAHALKAYQTDRLSPQANNILALNFVLNGDDVSALKHAAVAREFGLGGAVPDWMEYFVALRKQDWPGAIEVMTNSLKRGNQNHDWVATTVAALEEPTLIDAALEKLVHAHQTNSIGPTLEFMQYVLLGAANQVFAQANTQLGDHTLGHLWLFLPEAAPLRKSQRFVELMNVMQLTSYWEQHEFPDLVAHLKY